MTEGTNCDRRDNFDIRGQIVTLGGGGTNFDKGDNCDIRGQL